jgi:hypothetical protein
MKRLLFLLIIFAAAFGCTQTYTPPAIANPATSLVVEGFIDSGPDSTYFDLTHTFPLDSTAIPTPIPELGAAVTIQGTDNSSYPLGQVGNGLYGAQLPTLQPNTLFRIDVKTTSGKEYASDYVPLVSNPPIDSVNWVLNQSGLNIYANTHSTTSANPYFLFEYQETWKFYSAYFATLQYVNGSFQNYSPNTIDSCWRSDNSTRIILASSTQLVQNEIYEVPLVFIPVGTQQLSVKYSILVKQYALTKDAFSWWSIMQNNTENIGSIFGVLPTTNAGNIHCLTDTTEQVVGYVSAGNSQSQRIFITNAEVNPWVYIPPCTDVFASPDSALFLYSIGYLPVLFDFATGKYEMAPGDCVNCTFSGTNNRPPFWQ